MASKVIRLPIVRNKNYKPSGLKSYVWLLHKYNISPKAAGPYRRQGNGALEKVLADGTSGAVYECNLHHALNTANLFQHCR